MASPQGKLSEKLTDEGKTQSYSATVTETDDLVTSLGFPTGEAVGATD